jgi:hypothetical protein
MPRTEKKFGTANQVSSASVTQLVAPSANRKNVIINAAGRGTGTLDIAVTTGTMALGTPTSATSSVTTTTRTAFVTSVDNATYAPDGNSSFRNGIAFNKEMTKAAWLARGNSSEVASGTVNPSTGAVTASNANTYFGTGNSTFFYYLQYLSTDPMPGSNSLKIFGTAGVNDSTATSGNGAQSLFGSFGRSRYNAISSSSNYMQYSVARLDQQNLWIAYSYNATVPITGDTYGRGVAFVTVPNHSNATLAKGCYFITEPEQGYTGHCVIGWNTSYAGGSLTGSSYAYNGGGIPGPATNAEITSRTSTVFPFAYNSQRDHWAISLTTSGNGHGNTWSTSVGSSTMTTVSASINPGFRITADDSGGTFSPIRAFFAGTNKTPAMPTGVTVPVASDQPLKSLKFSPDGTKLAVGYNRDYSGSGITNSVIIIYTWNAGTSTWEHTHSSGSAIPFRPYNNDCMVWSDDSSVLAIAGTDGFVRAWGPGLTADASKVGVSISSGPTMASLTSAPLASPVTHASTFTGSLNAGTGLAVNGNNPGSFVRELVYAPTSGSPYRFVAIMGHVATAALTSADHTSRFDVTTLANVPVTNYVSSVASNLPVVEGNVTQITGVVLEANEGLAVEASVSGIVDVNAYGVEIS